MIKKISILGSTGSVGVQTLEVVLAFSAHFSVWGLSCGENISLFKEQIRQFLPQMVCVRHECDVADVINYIEGIGLDCEVVWGELGLIEISTSPSHDLLIVAIVGTAALVPTYEAILSGVTIGLASKEVLVSAGAFLMPLAREYGVKILPLDSEHAAIHQCLAGVSIREVSKLILTASGGPFLNTDSVAFSSITLAQALQHPKWSMGPKISIDSATLMNKGLEVIEAYHLFGVDLDQVDVVIHPQSVVHSFVEFKDGTLLAQLGVPDMRLPIQYVMTYPEKWDNGWPKLDVKQLGDLTFQAPDLLRFPLLGFAYDCARQGGTWPAVMNAANEAFVGLFLEGKIGFSDISSRVMDLTESFAHQNTPSLLDIIELDREVKEKVRRCLI